MVKILNGVICSNIGLVINMKHIVVLVLIISSVFFFASCATKSQKAEDKQNAQVETGNSLHEETFSFSLPANHSFLTEKNIGETITVKGKLLRNGNSFSLIENPVSKSRVTFDLEVTEESLIKKLQELTDQTITITGELTEASSPWTKKMKVTKVE